MNLIWERGFLPVKSSETDFDFMKIQHDGKRLFLYLITTSLLIAVIITTGLWWLIYPRLLELSSILCWSVFYTVILFYLIVFVGIFLMFLTIIFEKNFLISKFSVRLSINFLFPLAVILAKVSGIKKDKVRKSFIMVNNALFKSYKRKFQASKILILLPHCLQHIDCKIRITKDIKNCINCGKCNIADLVRIADQFKVNAAVATGGTLARRIIKDIKPEFIIAVACERDLVDGLREVFPVPVYGILNDRPEGPCINTRVALGAINRILSESVLEER